VEVLELAATTQAYLLRELQILAAVPVVKQAVAVGLSH
jgi:hypothetical protein